MVHKMMVVRSLDSCKYPPSKSHDTYCCAFVLHVLLGRCVFTALYVVDKEHTHLVLFVLR